MSRLNTLFPNPNLQNIDHEQVSVVKTIKASRKKSKKWLIVHQVGFMSSQPIPEDILYFWKKGLIQMLPRGGVALSLTSGSCNGKLFCGLPLPGQTGLPVHINGHFALGHEARRDLWHGTTDYRVQWNNLVIQAVICPSYIEALKIFQSFCSTSCLRTELKKWIETYYKQFPITTQAGDQYIQHLVISFYTAVGSQCASLFPVVLPSEGKFYQQQGTGREKMTVKWVPVTCSRGLGFVGYFDTLRSFLPIHSFGLQPLQSFCGSLTMNKQRDQESNAEKQYICIEQILKDLGMKLVESSEDIQRQFEYTDFKDDIRGTSPEDVTLFLKSNFEQDEGGCCIGSVPKKVQDTHLKSVENVKVVTKFCKKMDNFECSLLGLPLKVSHSNLLSRFGDSDVMFVTSYGHILPSSSDRLLHKDLVSLYEKHDLLRTQCMKSLTIEDFAFMLQNDVECSFYLSEQPVEFQWTKENQTWICQLWDFVRKEVGKKVKQSMSDVKNHERMSYEKKKQFENRFRINALEPLQDWSLIPTHVGVDNLRFISLYPLKQSEHIINLKITESKFEKVLKSLPLPKLTKSVFCQSETCHLYFESLHFCEDLVACSDDPRKMLAALATLTDADSNLTQEGCRIVLQYFSRNIHKLKTMNVINELKKLPFYPSLSGHCVTLENWQQVSVVTDSHPPIPGDGLRDLFERSSHLCIKDSHSYRDLLTHLELTKLSRERMYADIIVPNLMRLSPDARMKHLLYIRDKIYSQNSNHTGKRSKLIVKLKRIPFITTRDGNQQCVSDFYTSRKPELGILCPPNSFLPQPYNDDEWQTLLTELGLKLQLSAEDFVLFANDLEEKSDMGITSEVKQKSELLTKILQVREDDTDDKIWYKIRDIRFVLPFNITEEHSDGRNMDNIHSQHEKAERLVAYADCYNPMHCFTIWTSCSMWTVDADPTKHMNRQKSVEVLKALGVSQEPLLEHCIVHLKNISKALKQKDVIFLRQQQKLLETIFTDIYESLQKHLEDAVIRQMLSGYPVVFITDTCELVPAAEVVIDLGTSENIPNYISRAPPFFGRFFNLFENLGAQKTVSQKLYALVLSKLYRKTKGRKLNANELGIVEKVVLNLVGLISKAKEEEVETGTLYLPNEECMLVESSKLVLNDRDDLASRLESENLNFFLGFEGVEIPMEKLHVEHRLVSLSSLVTETLSTMCSGHVSKCGEARLYEQRIKSSEFVNGILRLCKDQSKEFSTNECLEEIEEKISQVDIFQVDDLETVLVFKENEIEGSEENKSCFIDMNAGDETEISTSICKVYISSSHSQEDTITQIAFGIDSLAKRHLGRYTSLVEKMLLMEPDRIQSYLDTKQIKKLCRTKEKSPVSYPRVGTLVPEEFHDTLINKFFRFSVGEYVGLCVYDPSVDDVVNDSKGALPVYVYAIVEKVENDTSPIAARYRLQVEEDISQIVSATMMYKLYREETDTNDELMSDNTDFESSDLESILLYVRGQLQEWDCLSTKERHKLQIRLLTVWHPDRNPQNVQICKTVCQHISLYVEHLNSGGSLDISHMKTETADMSVFYEVSRRLRVQREIKRNARSDRRKVYPHIGEALRWLKQAEKDLEAADKSIKCMFPSNWSCYLSHQAAEKALKAVLYTKDSQKADAFQNHNITSIAHGLGVELEELASQMNNRVGNYNGMRYPNRWAYPGIPSETFSSSDATLCYDLATQIVDIAVKKVQRL